jgi:hypothetical protein
MKKNEGVSVGKFIYEAKPFLLILVGGTALGACERSSLLVFSSLMSIACGLIILRWRLIYRFGGVSQ